MPIDKLLLQVKLESVSEISYEDIQIELEEVKNLSKDLNFSLHGFDFQIYMQLLMLTKNCFKKLEDARISAIKLTILFGNTDRAIAYLKRYEEQYEKKLLFSYGSNEEIISSACRFHLPKEDQWNIALWRALIAYHNPNTSHDIIIRLFPFAKRIEDFVLQNQALLKEAIVKEVTQEHERLFSAEYDEILKDKASKKTINSKIKTRFESYFKKQLNLPALKDITAIKQEKSEYILARLKESKRTIASIAQDKLLSPTTPIEKLTYYARHVYYERAQENPEAAEVFFTHMVPESDFNDYLKLIPQDDPTMIPNIVIDGKEIAPEYAQYVLKNLSSKDPRAAIIGRFTGCCMSIDRSGGREFVQYAITKPNSGFYVLFEKNKNPNKKEKIIAKTWVRRKNDRIIFDSIESGLNYRSDNKNSTLLADFYTYLGQRLVNEHGVERVFVGSNGKFTPGALGILKPLFPILIGKVDSPDSQSQRIIADKEVPLANIYRCLNQDSRLSALQTKNKFKLNLKAVYDFCDLCVANELDWKSYIPFINGTEISEEMLEERAKVFKIAWDYFNKNFLGSGGKSLVEFIKQDFNWDGNLSKEIIELEIVKLYIASNDKPDIEDENGKNARDYASEKKKIKIVEYFNSLDKNLLFNCQATLFQPASSNDKVEVNYQQNLLLSAVSI